VYVELHIFGIMVLFLLGGGKIPVSYNQMVNAVSSGFYESHGNDTVKDNQYRLSWMCMIPFSESK